MIALNLNENKRIMSACVVLPHGNYDGMPIVEKLPDGDITDYLYKNGRYIYDPKPVEPKPEPEPSLETRVATVEADVAALTTAIERGLAL